MHRKENKYYKVLLLLIKTGISIIVFFPVFNFIKQVNFRNEAGTSASVFITVELKSRQSQTFEVFYNHSEGFTQEKSTRSTILGKENFQRVDFLFKDVSGLTVIRFDPNSSEDTLWIKSMTIKSNNRVINWNAADICQAFAFKNQCALFLKDSLVALRTTGADPYIFTGPDQVAKFNTLLNRGQRKDIALAFGIIAVIFVFLSLFFIPNKIISENKPGFTSIFLILSFSVMLVGPFILKKTKIFPDDVSSEKRFKAPFPEISVYALADFPDDFAAWFNDHIGGRDILIKSHSYIKTQVFGVSPLPEKVMLGKNGWLFYADENTPDYYRNAKLFSDEELIKIKNNLEQRDRWCRVHGAKFYVMLPPMASSIYPEYLPETIKKENPVSCLDQVLRFLADEKANVSIIDMGDEFRKEKLKRPLYYKTDFHWNFYGAFLAYRKLVNTINRDTVLFKVPGENDFNMYENPANDGDLASLLNLPDLYPRIKQVMIPKIPNKAHQVPANHYPSERLFKQEAVVYQNDSVGLPVLVMFRDSYGNYLMPFLSEHFSKSCYIWTNHFIPEIIEIERPAIVVQEIVEKFIRDLLLENPEEMNTSPVKEKK